jgi:CelD/BcsL family acetyltransferase involved in cellulose biosynthesis
MSLQVTRLEDTSSLLGLQAEWTALLERCPSANPFLTWEWMSTWWRIYGADQRLLLLAVRDGGRLVGLAPLKSRERGWGLGRLRVAEFIGTGSDVVADHLDVIVAAGHEAAVVGACAAHLAADREIRGIDLRAFSGRSPVADEMYRALVLRRGHLQLRPHSVCPQRQLPATWAAFMAAASKNYRKKLGEYERRCARDHGAALRVSDSPDALARDLARLITLHQRRWGARSRAFVSPQYRAFHAQLTKTFFERGWIRMLSLDTPDEAMAVLYCYAYNGRYYYYQAGWNPDQSKHRPGLVLLHNAMRLAIGEGATVFDFLRGREEYKYLWADADVTNVQLAYWRSWPDWAVQKGLHMVDQARQSPLWAQGPRRAALLPAERR